MSYPGEDAAKYRLRKGMAKVAQLEQATGKRKTDAYGRALRASEMAQRHSKKTVAQWAKGYKKTYVIL